MSQFAVKTTTAYLHHQSPQIKAKAPRTIIPKDPTGPREAAAPELDDVPAVAVAVPVPEPVPEVLEADPVVPDPELELVVLVPVAVAPLLVPEDEVVDVAPDKVVVVDV